MNKSHEIENRHLLLEQKQKKCQCDPTDKNTRCQKHHSKPYTSQMTNINWNDQQSEHLVPR
jgi:hypothetical protein